MHDWVCGWVDWTDGTILTNLPVLRVARTSARGMGNVAFFQARPFSPLSTASLMFPFHSARRRMTSSSSASSSVMPDSRTKWINSWFWYGWMD